jgi:hypothetical protein
MGLDWIGIGFGIGIRVDYMGLIVSSDSKKELKKKRLH